MAENVADTGTGIAVQLLQSLCKHPDFLKTYAEDAQYQNYLGTFQSIQVTPEQIVEVRDHTGRNALMQFVKSIYNGELPLQPAGTFTQEHLITAQVAGQAALDAGDQAGYFEHEDLERREALIEFQTEGAMIRDSEQMAKDLNQSMLALRDEVIRGTIALPEPKGLLRTECLTYMAAYDAGLIQKMFPEAFTVSSQPMQNQFGSQPQQPKEEGPGFMLVGVGSGTYQLTLHNEQLSKFDPAVIKGVIGTYKNAALQVQEKDDVYTITGVNNLADFQEYLRNKLAGLMQENTAHIDARDGAQRSLDQFMARQSSQRSVP